jgi:hypothetical protein
MRDLAARFFAKYRDRLAAGQPQLSNPTRKTVLERVIEELDAERISEAAAIDRIATQGFNDVVPRFHR